MNFIVHYFIYYFTPNSKKCKYLSRTFLKNKGGIFGSALPSLD